jgi:hypothetical protein
MTVSLSRLEGRRTFRQSVRHAWRVDATVRVLVTWQRVRCCFYYGLVVFLVVCSYATYAFICLKQEQWDTSCYNGKQFNPVAFIVGRRSTCFSIWKLYANRFSFFPLSANTPHGAFSSLYYFNRSVETFLVLIKFKMACCSHSCLKQAFSGLRFSLLWGWWSSSGFWRRVDSSIDANVSEKHTVSIFSPEDGDSMFSETLASTGESTWPQNPDENHHQVFSRLHFDIAIVLRKCL